MSVAKAKESYELMLRDQEMRFEFDALFAPEARWMVAGGETTGEAIIIGVALRLERGTRMAFAIH